MAELAAAVAGRMSADDGNAAPEDVRTEWEEFFAEGVFSVLLTAFAGLAAGEGEASDQALEHAASGLAAALPLVPDRQLFEHQLPAKFLVEDVDCDANFPESLLFLLNHLCPLVNSQLPPVRVTAFSLLQR